MPTKHNKKRYQSKTKERQQIMLTGQVYLQYEDEEKIPQASKGDLLAWPQNEALHTTRLGEYDQTGFSGYFKVDVHDGKEWRALLLNDIFPGREHHFSKSECPIDTYALCADILRSLKDRVVERTYREHYELQDNNLE